MIKVGVEKFQTVVWLVIWYIILNFRDYSFRLWIFIRHPQFAPYSPNTEQFSNFCEITVFFILNSFFLSLGAPFQLLPTYHRKALWSRFNVIHLVIRNPQLCPHAVGLFSSPVTLYTSCDILIVSPVTPYSYNLLRSRLSSCFPSGGCV